MPNLDAIVKAYDIRGTVPDQLDAEAAYALGVAFVKFTRASAIVSAMPPRPEPSTMAILGAKPFSNGRIASAA